MTSKITLRCFLTSALLLLFSLSVMAQTKTVTGTVKDNKGLPLPGVTITEKGGKNNATTDNNGVFSIKVAQNATLIFKSIGFFPDEIAVGSKKELTVEMKEDVTSLNDVVVVAYGTQKKINMTGAVETITAKSIANRPVTSAVAMLQGLSPSLTISTPAGGNSPGSRPTIQIRGQAALNGVTEPLVVIDGIPSSVNDYNTLNPNAIESVTVLKDAGAAAIYGARAPYGVLVVTTKMGKKNEKPVITYTGNTGVVYPVRMPHTVDSYTFALSRNQGQLNGNLTPYFTDAALDIIKDNIDNPGKYSIAQLVPPVNGTWPSVAGSYFNNDMVDIWLKPSVRQQHDISVKGGSDKTTYFVSAAVVYQPGILNFIGDIDNYRRYNLNAGLVAEINPWLKMTYRNRYSLSHQVDPTNSRGDVYAYAFGGWPTTALYYPTGEYGTFSRVSIMKYSGDIKTNIHNLDNILALDMNFKNGWTAHVDGDWRLGFTDSQNLKKPVYEIQPTGTVNAISTVSSVSKSTTLDTYWTLQGYMAYEKTLGKHTLRGQVGAQAEEANTRVLAGTANDLIDPTLPAIAIATGVRTVSDAVSTWATQGYFGRFNYDYDKRYLLELDGRYDGSGRYSADKRWGFFPSGSAAWNMSNEEFWKNIEPVVNRAKFRVSYGTVGNQGNSAGYLHIPTMGVGAQAGWIIDGARLPFVNPPGILNMDRTWEKLTTLNFGLELGMLNNRLTSEFDYFNRESYDIIGPATPLPGVLGTSAPDVNNAAFMTKGWELIMKWADNINKDWDYSVGFNIGDASSKITKYNTTINSISGWYVGKEMNEIWGYTANRLLNKGDFDAAGKLLVDQSQLYSKWTPGDVKYEDLNGDGKVNPGSSTIENPGDLHKIGNSTPRYHYGINLATGYNLKNAGRLDLSLFFEGVGKRDVFLGSNYVYWGAFPGGNTILEGGGVYKGKSLDYYRDENSNPRLLALLGQNTDAYYPKPYGTSGEGTKNFITNTRYLINGAYLRMKNIQLNYTLPQDMLNKAKIKNCSLYFSGENLFVLSHLPSYLDPEFTNGGRMYPQQAVYSLGVNIGF